MVINIPKETMAYVDYPFPDEYLSFTTHGQVLEYLENYAETYGLLPFMKFKSRVTGVRLAVESPGVAEEESPLSRWEVTYQDGDLAAEETASSIPSTCLKTEIFDAVCVASGHYDTAFKPEVDGFANFQGHSMHSRDYDTPDVEAFIGKRVLCVGASYSGSDVAREISSRGKFHAYTSHVQATVS